jgi:hypothetical protein
MSGRVRKTHRKHGSTPGKKHAAAKRAPQAEPGLVGRMIELQKLVGNGAARLVIEGMQWVQSGQPQSGQPQSGQPQSGQPQPAKPQAPVEERWAQFQEHLNATWNQEISTDEKYLALGDWYRYVNSDEFDAILKKDYDFAQRYERYAKYNDPSRAGKPKDFGSMTVTYGDDSDQARAERNSDTLGNMEGSFGGALFEWAASFLTDDPVKLNAASGLGAGVGDLTGGAAAVHEARASRPSLSASRPDITTQDNYRPAEDTSPAQQAEVGAAGPGNLRSAAPAPGQTDPVQIPAVKSAQPAAGQTAPPERDDAVKNATVPPAPKVTRLPPGPRPPDQVIGIKEDDLPEGTHKISTTTRTRTSSLNDEQQLRANMEADGIEVPDGHAAHHMVLKKGGGHLGEVAREQLRRLDIGINDADNGVPLPGTNRPRGTVPEPVGGPYHGTAHTKAYWTEVAKRLSGARTEEEGRAVLRQIRRDIIDGSFPH